MDFIEGQGAVSDDLTPVLLTTSENGRPLRVKRAAKTRVRPTRVISGGETL
jgi:hypothetical protein